MTTPFEAVVATFKNTPYMKHLGMDVVETAPDMAKMSLTFKPELAGGGKAYHGGAISSLIDTTGALAAWSGHDMSKGVRASTVTMTVQYLAAAQGEDVVAEGRVMKRGRDLIYVDVEARTKAENRLIAKGVMVYRIA